MRYPLILQDSSTPATRSAGADSTLNVNVFGALMEQIRDYLVGFLPR